jgi:hypothetical protein
MDGHVQKRRQEIIYWRQNVFQSVQHQLVGVVLSNTAIHQTNVAHRHNEKLNFQQQVCQSRALCKIDNKLLATIHQVNNANQVREKHVKTKLYHYPFFC